MINYQFHSRLPVHTPLRFAPVGMYRYFSTVTLRAIQGYCKEYRKDVSTFFDLCTMKENDESGGFFLH
jgi:hypothetical protein